MRKIKLTRDSVAMADDINDNSLEIEVNEEWLIDKILDEIIKINYLPKIDGGKATWSVSYDFPLAIMAQEWGKPKIINANFPFSLGKKHKDFNRLHFNYHTQIDPNMIYEAAAGFKSSIK